MEMVQYYKRVFVDRYAEFGGRSGRAEYWWAFLGNVIITAVLTILGTAADVFVIVHLLYWLAVLVPGLAVVIRRLHDTGRSGWWALILLVPLIGSIVLLVFMVTKGDAGPNEYGPPDPGLSPAPA